MLKLVARLLGRQPFVATVLAVLLLVPLVLLRLLGDLSTFVVEAIALGLVAGVVYFVALYAFTRTDDRPAALALILLAALAFRLVLLPMPPTLSDDVHRYRWDARVQQAGLNPYQVRPDDTWLAGLRGEFRARGEQIPGADAPSVYGPLAQLTYRATFRFLPDAIGFKVPMLAADLLICLLLAGWVRRSAGQNVQVAIYAWNPLVVVEFAASGHNDALALAALLAATLVIIGRRPVLSTLLLAAAALVKFFPAVLAPLWLRKAGWPGRARAWLALGAAAALAAACWWPYREAGVAGLAGAVGYFSTRWVDNNASLYALTMWFTGSRELALGAGIGIVAGLAVWAAARRMDTARTALLLVGAVLLFSPNAFPWYFTWMVPLVALVPGSRYALPWLLLTVLQFLSYHVLVDFEAFGVWEFRAGWLWLTYAPFFAWLICAALRRGNDSAEILPRR